MVAYGLLVNLPFIAIQRYNRLRASGCCGCGRRGLARQRVGARRGRVAGSAPQSPGTSGSSIP